MDTLHGSARWHDGVGRYGDEWAEDRPSKRLRTSKSHASTLYPVSWLVRNPFDTLGSIAETLGLRSDNEKDNNQLLATEKERQLHLLRLRGAKTSEEWKKAALELDQLEGNSQWKDHDESEEYDYELVKTRLRRLQEARQRDDLEDMRFQIRTALTRDLGGMGNVRLYKHSRIGTKSLIERYIDTVVDTIDTVINHSGLEPRAVFDQMKFARQAFGRSALLLSGGGTLGMNHIGVVKALFQAGLLPRIISGASAGSIVCSVLCIKTDDEIPQVLEDFCHGDLDVFEEGDKPPSLFRIVKRLCTAGVIYDIENLQRVMRNMLGNITFNEAYNRTQRILNICVSSAGLYEMPRLLNYITAPDVVIWSAVAASCSVPLVFTAANIMSKDPKSGELRPWDEDTGKWIDGSVDSDLPMTRLAEMLNVNHFIVSQVNPHVIPFLAKEEDEISPDVPQPTSAFAPGPSWLSTMANLAKGEALHRMHVLAELGIFSNTMTKLRSVLGQRYAGDITIIPEISYTQFPHILTNPTSDFMAQAMFNGERATWPKLSRIRNHLAVELKLDEAVRLMRARVAFSPSQVDLRMNSFVRPTVTTRSERGRSRHGSKGSPQSAMSTIVPRELPARHPGHRLAKSMLDSPSTAHEMEALKVAGPSGSDYMSSADDTASLKSISPALSDADEDGKSVMSDTSDSSPPSPSMRPERWPSTRPLFPSLTQPAASSMIPKPLASSPPTSPRTPTSATAASLTMTPSSPETRSRKLFPGNMKPTPAMRSRDGIHEVGGEHQSGLLGLNLDIMSTRGMVKRRQRSLSTGLAGLKPPQKQ